jgi:flagellin
MNPAGATQAGTPSSITFSGATGVGGANPAFSNLVIGDTITFEYRVDGIDQKFVHVITADDMIGDDMETGLGKDLIRALRAAFNDFDITMPTNIIPGAGPEGGITLVGDIGIRSRENGFETLVATGASVNKAAEGQITRLITVAQDATGSNDFREIDLALTDSRFLEIDGRRFQFVSDPSQLEQGNLAIFVQTAGIVSASDMSSVVGQLRSFGYAVTTVGIDTTAHPTSLRFEAGGMGSGLTLQIGANGGQDQRVNLFVDAMDSTSIGLMQGGKLTVALSSADIRTIETANMAIEIITGATNTVSGQRAALGALQNRLEHTMNNLAVSKENLTASESIIRDVDMAKEMMEFTKNQILVQASQAMLAQANQLPQGVLSLLR